MPLPLQGALRSFKGTVDMRAVALLIIRKGPKEPERMMRSGAVGFEGSFRSCRAIQGGFLLLAMLSSYLVSDTWSLPSHSKPTVSDQPHRVSPHSGGLPCTSEFFCWPLRSLTIRMRSQYTPIYYRKSPVPSRELYTILLAHTHNFVVTQLCAPANSNSNSN